MTVTDAPGVPVESANLEPWFGPHLQRNIYLSLLHLEPAEGAEKSPKVPDSILRAALLRRAVEDIHRIIQIRTAKAACSNLLQRGSVGDDLWQRFSRAEKEMEEELRDVVMEVGYLISGLLFGLSFFPLSFLFLHLFSLRSCRRINRVLGQCARTELGPDHLPIRQRDRRQHHLSEEDRRHPGPGRAREGVVGEAPSHDSKGLHKGAERRRDPGIQHRQRGRAGTGRTTKYPFLDAL